MGLFKNKISTPLTEKRLQNNKKFVIITIPRTGSSVLTAALNSHPEIICHGELFHADAIFYSRKVKLNWLERCSIQERNRDPESFLQHIWTEEIDQRNYIIGFKIFRTHHRQMMNDLIKDHSVKKIILKRDNLLMAFLSRLEASQSGVWDIPAGKPRKEISVKSDLDMNEFRNYVNDVSGFFNRIENKLARSGQGFLTLYYHSMLNNEKKIRLMDFLGANNDLEKLRVKYQKQNVRSIEERINNPEMILAQVRGSDLERYFLEEENVEW